MQLSSMMEKEHDIVGERPKRAKNKRGLGNLLVR